MHAARSTDPLFFKTPRTPKPHTYLLKLLDWIGLDVYFHHEHETKNNYIKSRVTTRLMLYEARRKPGCRCSHEWSNG